MFQLLMNPSGSIYAYLIVRYVCSIHTHTHPFYTYGNILYTLFESYAFKILPGELSIISASHIVFIASGIPPCGFCITKC